MMTIRLIPDNEATTVTITDALYGRIADGTVNSLQSGWMQLFGDGLKAFVESAG